MTITITITGDTAQDVLFQLQGLAGAAGQQSAPAGLSTATSAAAAPAAAPAPKPSRGKKDAPVGNAAGAAAADSSTSAPASAASASGDAGNASGAAALTEQAPAAPAASTNEAPTVPSDAKAPSPADLRTKIRTLLTPLMAGDKAVKVQELIARYGGSISKCKDEELGDLLEDAQELAE